MNTQLPLTSEIIDPAPTLADVISRLRTLPTASGQRRNDMISACLCTAKMAKRPPGNIRADAQTLREIFGAVAPAMAGMNRKRWANIRSEVLAACVSAKAIPELSTKAAVTPEWGTFVAHAPRKHHIYMVMRFARFCSETGLSPCAVTDETLARFRQYIEARIVCGKPQQILRDTQLCFNIIARAAGIGVKLSSPLSQMYRAAPLTAYHPTLQQQITTYLGLLGARDDFTFDAHGRELKPLSLRNTSQHLLQFLDAVSATGYDTSSTTTIADLLLPEIWKRAFTAIQKRTNTPYPAALSLIARTLIAMARHYLKSPDHILQPLRLAEKKISGENGLSGSEMGKRSQNVMRQFDDPANIKKIKLLPQALLNNAPKQRRTYDGAVDAMVAAAITILLCAPLRMKNLAGLTLGQQIIAVSPGKKGLTYEISIPAGLTKNGVAIEVTIPPSHAPILTEYLTKWRPELAKNDQGAFFPAVSGQPRDPGKLGAMISARILKLTDIHMTPHCFRHLGAKIILNHDPSAVYQVQQVLHHKKLATTLGFYCDGDKSQAFKTYHSLLEE